jgi:activator of 2-hydroxyglutaryl-CoA dehydratase
MTRRTTLGLDIGSTTIKLVLLDGDEVLFSAYRRHHADVQAELVRLLDEVAVAHPGLVVRGAVTGSGGLGVSGLLGLTFVQEVVAGTAAVEAWLPGTDVVIELGGEDAKITYCGGGGTAPARAGPGRSSTRWRPCSAPTRPGWTRSRRAARRSTRSPRGAGCSRSRTCNR